MPKKNIIKQLQSIWNRKPIKHYCSTFESHDIENPPSRNIKIDIKAAVDADDKKIDAQQKDCEKLSRSSLHRAMIKLEKYREKHKCNHENNIMKNPSSVACDICGFSNSKQAFIYHPQHRSFYCFNCYNEYTRYQRQLISRKF